MEAIPCWVWNAQSALVSTIAANGPTDWPASMIPSGLPIAYASGVDPDHEMARGPAPKL